MSRLRLALAGVGAALAFALSASSPSAAPVPCDPIALSVAIENANSIGGSHTIDLAPGCVYSFVVPYSSAGTPYSYWYGPSALPAIASDITLQGHGATIERAVSATAPFRLFFVGADPADPDTFDYASPGAGVLTLRDLTLRGGLAAGGGSGLGGGGAGMGGAILSQGQVTLVQTTLTTNTARGGAGGLGGGGSGGGGIGAASSGSAGGGFGPWSGSGGGSGGAGAVGGGGGGGFRPVDDGAAAAGTVGGFGGGPSTGTGGAGAGSGGAGGNGAGGGAGGLSGTGGGGGGFGLGGAGPSVGGGGGGAGVGGGGGSGGGAGGFGGGGGSGGGAGGFGGGGGSGGGAGGFGGGNGGASSGGGGAGLGGAIFNDQGELSIQNSTLSGNAAVGGTGAASGQGLGGAIFNLNGAATLDSVTVASNSAGGGGALYNLGYLGNDTGDPAGHTYAAQTTLANTILADSTGGSFDAISNVPVTVAGGSADTATGTVNASAADLVETRSAIGNGAIVGAPLTSDPGLGPLAANGGDTPTQAIGPGSPAFNAGATALATDQRGVTRPQGPADDIGAFEVGAPTAVVVSAIRARRHGRNVLVEWRVGAPPDLLGIDVYRQEHGALVRLNRFPLALPGAHRYSWLDRTAPRAGRLRYRLQAVGPSGQRTWIGSAVTAA